MGAFFVYILKSSVCLAVFYLFYRLLLSKETFHRFNRFALLGILLLSCIVPFMEVTVKEPTEVHQQFLTFEELLLTDVGDVLWLGLLSMLVAVLLAWRRRWLPLQIWVFAIGLNGLSTRVLKNAFDRARPEALHELVTSGASFPSGHTAGSVVVYGLLWWLVRARMPRHARVTLGAGLAVLVVLIAASRIWLEAHFASDVLAGVLLGLAILGLAIWALERGRAQL